MSHDSVLVGGRRRTFLTIGPDRASTLVLVFHGSKQDGAKNREFFGRVFDQLAGDDVAVSYLDGYKGHWNDARRESRFAARIEQIDDVGFARAVIERVGARSVYAIGYSNGGQMVMRLMHEAPDMLSGAAIFGATMPTPDSFLLNTAPAAMPVLLSHGTADPIVPYAGGRMKWLMQKLFKVGGESLSMPQTAEYFATHNGITTPPVSTKLPAQSAETSVERTEYRDHRRPPVVLYTVHGGGHTVPHSGKASSFIIGKTNRDVDAGFLVGEVFGLAQGSTSS
jgi:polyhydroxybutyrate depolymerase